MGPYFACAIWIICCNSASLSSAALCARSEARSASGVIGGNGEIAARAARDAAKQILRLWRRNILGRWNILAAAARMGVGEKDDLVRLGPVARRRGRRGRRIGGWRLWVTHRIVAPVKNGAFLSTR